MRARCVSEGAATTTVKAQTAESPYWKSVGASMTTSGVPTKKCQPTALKSPQMMCGCISRLSRRRSAWSLKIKSPSAVRSRTPSLTTPGNARPISKTSGVPGACIARTTSSTSTTGTPRARSHAVTVDLPHAMPPVRPTRSVMTTARARHDRSRATTSSRDDRSAQENERSSLLLLLPQGLVLPLQAGRAQRAALCTGCGHASSRGARQKRSRSFGSATKDTKHKSAEHALTRTRPRGGACLPCPRHWWCFEKLWTLRRVRPTTERRPTAGRGRSTPATSCGGIAWTNRGAKRCREPSRQRTVTWSLSKEPSRRCWVASLHSHGSPAPCSRVDLSKRASCTFITADVRRPRAPSRSQKTSCASSSTRSPASASRRQGQSRMAGIATKPYSRQCFGPCGWRSSA
mmetsp:Transcript_22592/g.70820  ORF Transcript_22592/g.70820 Transcript_22592/m.70820 type:complete len:403 (-) Transcript_22592:608-1816(-)